MQTNFSFLKNRWLTHTAVFLLVLILLVTSNLLQAQTVNISTDQDDYAPGEWVVITGSGWIPGDSVQLSITHIGDYIPNHTHAPWTLVTDANGNISDQWYVADIELNTTLWLQAQSISVSSMYAQKVFTDATAHYYYGGTGDLTNVNSWWSATNGTGTHPSNFTSNNQDFQIRNTSSVTLDANWVLTGNTALVIVGDGTNPCNLIIPSTVNLTSGTINVSAAATLTIQNTTIPAIGILGATSTIDYAASGNQTITSKTYGNLILSVSGAKTLGGATIANGTLTINSGVTLTTANNDLTFGGDFINNGGTLTAGSSKIMIANTNSTQNIAGITFAGTVYMTKTSGTATFTGNVSSNGLTINGIGGILNLGTGLTHTFSGTWTRTNGTLDGGSSTLKIGGNGSGSGGTFTAGTGTVEWNASGTQTIAAVAYNNLILSGSGAKTMTGVSTINGNFTLSGTASATATTGITIGRTLTLGSGTTFIAGNLIHNIKGDWTNNGGTFTNSGSTINFNGTVDQIIGGSNLTSFDKLSIGTGSKVNLSIFTHTANTLTLGGLGTASGTWGNTAGIDHPNTNYFASASGKVTVGSDTRTTPTITWANPAAITYGTALSATQLNATVSLPGSFVYTPASGAVLNAGNAQNLSVTFTPTDLTSYTTASKTVQINVNKLAIAVTAAAKTKVYGQLDTALTYTFTPALIGSDVFSGSLSRTAGEPVAVYAINQNTLALSTNYTLNYTSASLTITAMPITATANTGQTKVYGAADPAFTYTSVPTGTLANGAAVSFTGALDRVAGENVGTTYAIGQGNLANTNYTITFVSKNFAITAMPITVSANTGQTKVYGVADPSFTYTSVPTDTLPNGASVSFTGALDRAADEIAGTTYAIGKGTLANANYDITFVPADFAITQKALTVTANDKTRPFDVVNPTLDGTLSGVVDGDNITASYSTLAIQSSNVGPYAITAALNDPNSKLANYAVTNTPATLTITQAAASISVTDLSKTYNGAEQGVTVTSYPTGLAVNVTYAGSATVPTAAGTVAVVAALNNSNYTATNGTGNLVIGKADPTIAVTGYTGVYDGAAHGATGSAKGVNNEVLAGLDLGASFTNATGGTANWVFTDVTGNYNDKSGSVDIAISKAKLTVTADLQTKIYGATNPYLTFQYSGWQNGEEVTALTTAPTASTLLGVTSPVGVHTDAITVAGGVDENYDFTYVPANFTVTKAMLTVTADQKSKTYDGLAFSQFTSTITGFVNNENSSVVTGTTSYEGRAIGATTTGSHTITPVVTGLSALNYSFTPVNGTLVIEKSPLTVTAENKTKTYDGLEFLPFTSTITGFVNNESSTAVSGASTYEGTAVGATNAGSYTITPVITGLSALNYSFAPANGTLVIDKQEVSPVADTYFTGPLFYWRKGDQTTVNLTLAASIMNDPNYAGDITTARISFFMLRGGTLVPIKGAQNLPVDWVNPDDHTVGTASAILHYNPHQDIETLDIVVEVSGNYSNYFKNLSDIDPNDIAHIQIAVPTAGGCISGDVAMCNDNSSGYIKGAPGASSLIFDVEYDKKLKNAHGHVNMTLLSYYDQDGKLDNVLHTYLIKSTAISVLATNGSKASFTAKAEITEIIGRKKHKLEGNNTLQLELNDPQATVPASTSLDQISVTIYRNKDGGVWYSNNWINNKPQTDYICGGYISINGSESTSTTTTEVPVLDGYDVFYTKLCTMLIPNGISPNGDGINDYFKFDCIENYPNAVLRIYQNTGLLYENKHYGNMDFWGSLNDAWWHGLGTLKNQLPSGTYIYILDLDHGKKEMIKTGYVFLSR